MKMTNWNKSLFTILFVFVTSFVGKSAFAQDIDTMVIEGEQFFVYPFKMEIEIYYDYFEVIARDKKKEREIKKAQKAYEKDFTSLMKEEEMYDLDFFEYNEFNNKGKKKSKSFKYFIKAARQNPYPLLDQDYTLDYDVIPSLDQIPDGKYVQLFENFCLINEKGICQYSEERIAGVFSIKNNMLHGEAVWMNVKGDTLKNGRFENGLKEGVWRLEDRDVSYNLSEFEGADYLENGHPFIDTTIIYSTYSNGILNGPFKTYERSNYPIVEGMYENGEQAGEWLYRDVLDVDSPITSLPVRNRDNDMVIHRKTFAKVSDSNIVKQPWIRDDLIRLYDAHWPHFNTISRYSVRDVPFDLFNMAFKAEENLELDDEEFDAYEMDINEYSEYSRGYGMEYYSGEFQSDVYDASREAYLPRGYVIDSIGMIARYEGINERYYPNGQLMYRYEFKDGKLLKEDTIFWDNGQAHDVINFIPDSNHYVRSIYDVAGTIYKEIVYDSLGDYSHLQYFFDEANYVQIDGYKVLDDSRDDFFFYNKESTLDSILTEPTELFISWYKMDSSKLRARYFDPINRVYTTEAYNVIGEKREQQVKTFAEDFESWTGKSTVKYADLELVTTESGVYQESWYDDSIAQNNILNAYRNFEVASEEVLFKHGQPYSGEVEFNFGMNKLSIDKDALMIDFEKDVDNPKKEDKRAEKVGKKIELYRKKGKYADDPMLNYIYSVETDIKMSEEVFNVFFKSLLSNQFSIPTDNYSYQYSDYLISRKEVPRMKKIVGLMRNGKPDGVWISYDQFGAKMVEVPFVDGEVEGSFKEYRYEYPEDVQDEYSWYNNPIEDTFPSKRVYYLQDLTEYKNGLLDGTSTYYDWTGDILSKKEFKEGFKDGLSIERNKLAYSRSMYDRGMLDGYLQTYLTLPNQDSILLYDLNFQNDQLQGESKSYHINGNISKRGFFLDGAPIEDYEAFDSLGFRYHYVKFEYSFPVEEKIWEENELSVRYKFNWEDSIRFEPSDITSSESLDRMLVNLGFGGDLLARPYYGRPSLVSKFDINYHMTKYFPNDTVSRDGELFSGKQIGPWSFYDYDGELLYNVNYFDTIINYNDSTRFKSKGILTEVNAEGDTLYQSHIIERFGKYDCSHNDHYEVRQLYTIWEVNDSLGRMNGYVKNYYDNGVLQNEGQLKNGMPTGAWKIYDPFGKLNQYGMYVNGKRDGRWLSGDLSKTKYLGDICLNPNLPDLESEIKYRENLLDITIINYKYGKALNKQFYDVDMNSFLEMEDFEDSELMIDED